MADVSDADIATVIDHLQRDGSPVYSQRMIAALTELQARRAADATQPGEEEVKRMVARLSAMGLVVVPREPTEEMVRAMTALAPTWDDETSRRKWADALTASPKVQP